MSNFKKFLIKISYFMNRDIFVYGLTFGSIVLIITLCLENNIIRTPLGIIYYLWIVLIIIRQITIPFSMLSETVIKHNKIINIILSNSTTVQMITYYGIIISLNIIIIDLGYTISTNIITLVICSITIVIVCSILSSKISKFFRNKLNKK